MEKKTKNKKGNTILVGIFSVLVIASFCVLGWAIAKSHTQEVEKESKLVEITLDELQKKIEKKDKFILVVTQTDCSHCAEYKPVLKEVLAEYNITAFEIDKQKLNNNQEKEFNKIINISGTPTTVFFADGDEISTSSRITGAVKKEKIISRFKAMGYIE